MVHPTYANLDQQANNAYNNEKIKQEKEAAVQELQKQNEKLRLDCNNL